MEAEELSICSLPCLCDFRPPDPPPWMNESLIEKTKTNSDGWQSYKDSCLGETDTSTDVTTNVKSYFKTEQETTESITSYFTAKVAQETTESITSHFKAKVAQDTTESISSHFKAKESQVSTADNGLWGIGVFFGVLLVALLVAAAIYFYKKKKSRPRLDLSMYDKYNYLHHKAKRKETWEQSTDTLPTELGCDVPVNDSTVEVDDKNFSGDFNQNNSLTIQNGLPPIKTTMKPNIVEGSFKNKVGSVSASPTKAHPTGGKLPPLKINPEHLKGKTDISNISPPMAFTNSAYDASNDSGFDEHHPGKL